MIYGLMLGYLLVLAVAYDFLDGQVWRRTSFYIALVLLTALAGFRYIVGGDTLNYMYWHDLIPPLWSFGSLDIDALKFRPLWYLLSSLAKSIGDDFVYMQFLQAALVNAAVFRFIALYTERRYTAVLLYALIVYPFYNFEVLREALAAGVFLVSLPYLFARSWVWYYGLCVVAFCFHYSAIILFLVPVAMDRLPHVLYRSGNPRVLPLAVVFVGATVASTMSGLFLPLISLLGGVEASAAAFQDYGYSLFGLIAIGLYYVLLPVVVLRICAVSDVSTAPLRRLASVAIWIGCVVPAYYILYRFLNYFSVVIVVLAADAAHALRAKRRGRRRRSARAADPQYASVVFLACFVSAYCVRYFADTSDISPGSHWYQRWYPYHSVFDRQLDPARMSLIQGGADR